MAEEIEFNAPKNGGVVSVRIVRKPLLTFEKLASGQLWIGAVEIVLLGALDPSPLAGNSLWEAMNAHREPMQAESTWRRRSDTAQRRGCD